MTVHVNYNRVRVANDWAIRDLPNGDQVRAHLIPHFDPLEPERGEGMWNEGVTITRASRRDRMDDHDGLRRVLSHDWNYGPDWEEDDDTVARYLRIFHDVQHVEIHQRDGVKHYVIAEGMEEGADPVAIARAAWNEWLAWADGDVWGWESEHRTIFDAMRAEDDDDDEGWETGDSCWGYYGEDDARSGLAEALEVPEHEIPRNLYSVMSF